METVLKDNVFRLLMKYKDDFLCFDEEYAEGEVVYQHEDPGKFYVNIYDSNFRWPFEEIIITSLVCEKEDPGESFVKSLSEFTEAFDGENYATEVLSKTKFYSNRSLEDVKKAGIERHEKITKIANIREIHMAAKTHPELTEFLLQKIMEREVHLNLGLCDICDTDKKEYYLAKIEKHNKYYPNFSVEKAIEQYKNNEWDWHICPECGKLSFPVNNAFFCTNCLDIVQRGEILNKEEDLEDFCDLLCWWLKPKEMLRFFDVFGGE